MDKTLKVYIHYMKRPAGSGRSDARDPETLRRSRQQSVLTIKNTDNNCFWYALNCLLKKSDKALYEIARKDSRPKMRAKYGRELCEKAGWEWDKPVPLDAIPEIEKNLNVGICVMSLTAVPITGTTTEIWDNLIYKSSGGVQG